MKLISVEIKAEGWAGYTGVLGGFYFKDGISVEPIPMRIALRIGATLEAFDVDTKQRLHPSTYKLDYNPSTVEAKTETLLTENQIEKPDLSDVKTETTEVTSPAIDVTPVKIVMADGTVKSVYTRAQLEAIADRSGIAGLREISDPLALKGRSVSELIDRIFEQQ